MKPTTSLLLLVSCMLVGLVVTCQGLAVSHSESGFQLSGGDVACVTAPAGLNVHSGPCTTQPVVTTALHGDSFNVTSGAPITACGYTWVPLQSTRPSGETLTGWAAAKWLAKCGGKGWNKFGIGLVSPGNVEKWDYAQQLGGEGGWILLVFPGVDSTSTGPQASWVQAVNGAYARGLNVVVRLSPPWGSSHYRSESDDPQHLVYTTLANAFKAVVSGLPRVNDGRNLYLQLDNEPDLCYEWFCAKAASPLPYTEVAKEYAHFFVATVDAIRSLNDDRIKISTAPLAPGGNIQCGCCGSQSCSGDKPGITGLQYMDAMKAAIPSVFDRIDFLASHSYPAQGIGWGFNVPLTQGMPGLKYYELELQHINRTVQVLVTETGWATHRTGEPTCTEQQKASWTTGAYSQVWLPDNRIMGIMPFMLQDAVWGDQDGFGYVTADTNTKLPVFGAVQKQRCAQGFPPAC